MEALELRDHNFFCAVQYHPEYLSRPLRPSPPYVGLLLAASNQLDTDLGRNLKSLAIRSRNPSITMSGEGAGLGPRENGALSSEELKAALKDVEKKQPNGVITNGFLE